MVWPLLSSENRQHQQAMVVVAPSVVLGIPNLQPEALSTNNSMDPLIPGRDGQKANKLVPSAAA
jgi:hypothetical protein